jgi:hypothetical protein
LTVHATRMRESDDDICEVMKVFLVF